MNERNDLPKGWVWTTLGEIHLDKSKTIEPSKTPNELFELYSVPAFPEGKPEIILGQEIGSNKRIVEEGTVLLCGINPRINRVWVVGNHSQHKKIGSTEWIPFFKCAEIDSHFLAYFLQNSTLRDFLAANASGVGGSLMRVRAPVIQNYPFPLPPLPEQHRIVAKIEELFSDLDAGVAALETAQQQLKRHRQAVLQAAVTGKLTAEWRAQGDHKGSPNEIEPASVLLERIRAERAKKEKGKKKDLPPLDTRGLGELPEGWVWVLFDDILVELKNGFFYGRARTEPIGIPILRVNAVRPMKVSFDDLRYVPVEFDQVEQYQLCDRDLLFTRYNGTLELVGVCGLVRNIKNRVIYPDKLIRARVFDNFILPEYLEFYFASDFVRAIIERKAKTTAGQQGVSGGDLKSIPVAIPTVHEQHQIILEVERRLSVADEIEKTIETALLQAERLRQSILKRAFEGKLAPQDANDEAAEKLLERIRAERELTGKGGDKPTPQRRSRAR